MTKSPYHTVGVSFPDPVLLADAKARAARLGISFSAYVVRLVRQDLEAGGDFVLKDPTATPLDPKGVSPDVAGEAARIVEEEVRRRRGRQTRG